MSDPAEFGRSPSRVLRTAYEGASTTYRLEMKGLNSGSQDQLSSRELCNLWARSHYLVRNNAVAVTAKKRLQANWIGRGIRVRWMNPNHTPNKKMQTAWDIWVDSCTHDGYGNLYNLQTGWAAALYESGEVFCRMVINTKVAGKIPLSLQSLEAEMLDPTYTSTYSTEVNIPDKTYMGITFDETGGKPVAYNFWKQYPEPMAYKIGVYPQRVAVSAEEVIHIFERERPGQWRGIPMLAPLLLTIYEMDELTDATLQRQKAAQCISWIFENTNPASRLIPGIDRYTSPVNVDGVSPDTADGTTAAERTVFIEGAGGNLIYPQQGETVKFASIQDIGEGLNTLLKQQWMQISAALGLSYHQASGDLSEVNFSSIRAGLNELALRVEVVQQNLFINLGMTPVCNKFRDLASIYISGQMGETYPIFDVPKRLGVDPLKDAQADMMEVQAGFATLESKLTERNVTWEQMLADRERSKKAGIILTSVPDTIPTPTVGATPVDKTRPEVISKPSKPTKTSQKEG
jgi:lambda family phage portal protein